MTEKRETTGKPTSIRLSADRNTINADGEDVAVLRVEALDEKGRLVPTADDLIEFTVSGPGLIIGVGNGDPNCHQSDKGSKRSLFNGLAQLIVHKDSRPNHDRGKDSRASGPHRFSDTHPNGADGKGAPLCGVNRGNDGIFAPLEHLMSFTRLAKT